VSCFRRFLATWIDGDTPPDKIDKRKPSALSRYLIPSRSRSCLLAACATVPAGG
jgi:hypothetical protein